MLQSKYSPGGAEENNEKSRITIISLKEDKDNNGNQRRPAA
jgi:hypothetical protein